MFFKPSVKKLVAKRARIEDEIRGYLIARKTPPGKLMAEASRIKMELEVRGKVARPA
jgi:hypothetical protein